MVYFQGLINENTMGEFRNSPFLKIEIHDRDERENSRRRIGSVFGSENTDETIGRVSGNYQLRVLLYTHLSLSNRKNEFAQIQKRL